MENKYWIGRNSHGIEVLIYSDTLGAVLNSVHAGNAHKVSKGWFDRRYTNITADYLRNTKIRVESPEHSEFVQKLIFGAGGRWVAWGDSITRNTDVKHLFINNNLIISQSDDENWFDECTLREIKLPMPPQESKLNINPDCALNLIHDGLNNCKESEWPKIGDEVFFGVGHCDSGVVLCKHGDYLWIRTIDADAGSPMFVTKKTSSLKKPQAPLDILADLLIPIVSENSRETSGYTAEQIAKAIIAGEIEGLVYKGG